MKDEKELKPASMRVRDAAEALLTVILEQVCTCQLCLTSTVISLGKDFSLMGPTKTFFKFFFMKEINSRQ